MMLVSSVVISQVTMKATSLTIGQRPSLQGSYQFEETEYNISIPVRVTEEDVVHIYSAEKQTYVKLTKAVDIDGGIMWDAVDQDGDKCTMYLVTKDDATFLLITYSNIAWYYELQVYD